ncbi:hypothetical protein [Lysinibacillus fusiformis]
MEPNTATLLSGAMSMAGGIAGAVGAYWIASQQIKKQFTKQDNDRVLELRIEKLNEALTISNDYLNHLQKFKGKFSSIEIYINECIKNNYSHINESSTLSKSIVNELLTEVRECTSYKNELKKYKIFTPTKLDYQSIYDKTSELIENYKLYFKEFNDFPNSVSVAKVNVVHSDLVAKCDNGYVELEKVLKNIIDILEQEIKKLLNLE